MALEPLSPGIGPITCDLQRSVNILILLLDAAADEAMHMLSIQHAMPMDCIIRDGFRSAWAIVVLMHPSRSKFHIKYDYVWIELYGCYLYWLNIYYLLE